VTDGQTDRCIANVQTIDCTVASELNWELLQRSCWRKSSCWLIYNNCAVSCAVSS